MEIRLVRSILKEIPVAPDILITRVLDILITLMEILAELDMTMVQPERLLVLETTILQTETVPDIPIIRMEILLAQDMLIALLTIPHKLNMEEQITRMETLLGPELPMYRTEALLSLDIAIARMETAPRMDHPVAHTTIHLDLATPATLTT